MGDLGFWDKLLIGLGWRVVNGGLGGGVFARKGAKYAKNSQTGLEANGWWAGGWPNL